MRSFFILLQLLITLSVTNAQLCQGSLGDAVVNITFGNGPNYGPPLGSAITTYNYGSNGCPNDGLYVISNSLTSCFSGSWHVLSEDHTPGDVDGYMMVVNASFNPGEFYVQTINGLCAGTTYQLAGWIVNVQKAMMCNNNSIKPKVRFKVETLSGTVLIDYSTGEIAAENSPSWKQYGTFFTMPQGETSVVIRIINDAPGGCGNDLALDDITFRPCGALVTASFNGNSTTSDYCIGDVISGSFSANTVQGNVFYQWQTSSNNGATWTDISNATSPTYSIPPLNNAGTYLFRQTVSQGSAAAATACRVVSNDVTININPPPTVSIAPVKAVCEGENIMLTALGGVAYKWSGPMNYSGNNATEVISNVTLSNRGKYYVIVTSAKGCTSKDSVNADVLSRPQIFLSPAGTEICEGKSINLNVIGNGVSSWLWTPAKGLSANNISNPAATPDTTTTYVVTAINGTCAAKDSMTITVFDKPMANAGPDKVIAEGQSIQLNGQASGTDVSILWSPATSLNQSNILTPTASPTENTKYVFTVTSNKGCGVSIDSVLVRVYKDIKIPNAFSPNKDGINDTWEIPFLNLYPDAVLNVYDRYGQLVYVNKGDQQPWDGNRNGKPLATGAYYYLLDLNFGDKIFTGWVMIIR